MNEGNGVALNANNRISKNKKINIGLGPLGRNILEEKKPLIGYFSKGKIKIRCIFTSFSVLEGTSFEITEISFVYF